MGSDCPFCPIPATAEILKTWERHSPRFEVVAFEPLNPVVPGHLLIVPVQHVPHIGSQPFLSGIVMQAASEVAALIGDCNVITSKGTAATQTVNHLHVHIVPRREGDGLHLPWTGQRMGKVPSGILLLRMIGPLFQKILLGG